MSIPSTPFDSLPDSAFIRQSQLIPHVLPISTATLWKRVKAKKFPAPIKLSSRCTVWRVGEIRSWMNNPNQVYA